MKSVLCIFGVLLAVVAVNCGIPAAMKKDFDDCRAEFKFEEHHHGPPNFDDPKEKCFNACLMKKRGELVEGKISLDKVLQVLAEHNPGSDEQLKEKITECVSKANEQSEECEVAGAFGKCAFEAMKPPS